MRVIYHRLAVRDARQILDYYESEEKALGIRVMVIRHHRRNPRYGSRRQ